MDNIGREQELEVNGERYRLSRCTISVLRDFRDWAASRLPDPLEIVKKQLEGFPPHLQELMVKEALERANRVKDFASPEVQALLHSFEGMLHLLGLLLRPNHPTLTDQEIFDLLTNCLNEHGQAYVAQRIDASMGLVPEKKRHRVKATNLPTGGQ